MYNMQKDIHNRNKGLVKMVILQKVALVITIIGALNWGLIGFFDFNLVETLFESVEVIEKIIYILVGISGIINIGILFMNFEK